MSDLLSNFEAWSKRLNLNSSMLENVSEWVKDQATQAVMTSNLAADSSNAANSSSALYSPVSTYTSTYTGSPLATFATSGTSLSRTINVSDYYTQLSWDDRDGGTYPIYNRVLFYTVEGSPDGFVISDNQGVVFHSRDFFDVLKLWKKKTRESYINNEDLSFHNIEDVVKEYFSFMSMDCENYVFSHHLKVLLS